VNHPKLLRHIIGIVLLIIGFLAGFGSLATAQSPTPTTSAQAGLFKFVRTVQVTPDATFSNGGFVRVNYVPATDRLVVTFATKAELHPQPGKCKGAGHVYKEYTTDMQETGKSGTLVWITSGGPDSCQAGDWGSVMVDNTFYLVGGNPWHLTKFDAATWEKLAAIDIPLKAP
jgi:hypothetical protein